jgi:hypothetical protein
MAATSCLSRLLHRLQNLIDTRLQITSLSCYLLNSSTKSYSANPSTDQLLHLSYPPLSSVHQPLPIITMSVATIFTVFAGILALAGAYLYFFGIDPETKRELERKALKTMGENKLSYMAKGTSTKQCRHSLQY